MKLIETFHRSTMMDERLTLLAMLYIESACVDLDFNHTVDMFAAEKARCKTFRQLNGNIFSSFRKSALLLCGFFYLTAIISVKNIIELI